MFLYLIKFFYLFNSLNLSYFTDVTLIPFLDENKLQSGKRAKILLSQCVKSFINDLFLLGLVREIIIIGWEFWGNL